MQNRVVVDTQKQTLQRMTNRRLDEAIDAFRRHLDLPVMVCVSTNDTQLKHRVREVSTDEYCTLYDTKGHFYLEKLLNNGADYGIANIPVGDTVEIEVDDMSVLVTKRSVRIDNDTHEFAAACLLRRSSDVSLVEMGPLKDCVDTLQQIFLALHSRPAV